MCGWKEDSNFGWEIEAALSAVHQSHIHIREEDMSINAFEIQMQNQQ